jgi:hypothetical protein
VTAVDAHAGYAIDPIHGQADDALLPPIPPPVIGWQLTLSLDGRNVELHEHRDFNDAQRDGAAWLQQHGSDGISQWMARAAQASRRMQWDHGYRHAISKRGF